jgi:probable O-glycosylation ligase (exosortase A-associated)
VRDLIVFGIVLAALPVAVFRPYFGLLTYSWLAYMRPQDMAWGMTRVMPLSQWVAIATLLGLVLAVTAGRERILALKPQTLLLVLLCGWISLSTYKALVPQLASYTYGQYWKAILISVLTTGLVRDRRRFRIFLILMAFSIGFLGAKRGLVGLLQGGARYSDGPGGFMSDNNSFALVLNMMLPLLVGIAVVEKEKVIKAVAWTMAGLCLLTILFTFSRGGLLTLCAIAPMILWRSRRRGLVAVVLALGILGFVAFSSDDLMRDYVERASTISEYEEDGSAQGRINAWVTSWRAFVDYPLYGVGPNNLVSVFHRYSPEEDRFRVAHNAYLQILAECGLPALLLFLGAIGAAFWGMRRLRRETDTPLWAEVYARMLQISIVAYLIGSMFLNTAYSEPIYHLVALSVCLELAVRAEAEAPAEEEAAEPVEELPWWKRPLPEAGLSGRG